MKCQLDTAAFQNQSEHSDDNSNGGVKAFNMEVLHNLERDTMSPSWYSALKDEFDKPYFTTVSRTDLDRPGHRSYQRTFVLCKPSSKTF